MSKRFALIALAASLMGTSAPLQVQAAGTDPAVTAAIPASANPAASKSALKSGLDVLKADDLMNARAIRDRMPKGTLDRHILQWAIALSGDKSVPSTEIAEAAIDLPGWPGLSALRKNSEKALFRENPAPADVIAAFGGSKPQTALGAAILARALVATGNPKDARAVLAPLWRTTKMEAEDEQIILSEFGTVLTREDHYMRMATMLYDERAASAGRVSASAGASSLFKAWSAALRKDAKTPALLKAVPATQQKSAGFLFAKAMYLRKTENWKDAAAIMATAPRDKDSLIDPDAWWTERRIIARGLLDGGSVKLAYKTASMHAAESPAAAAEAEFHAGWIALRALNDPNLAATHFAKLLEYSSKPQSASRGYYWLGRAKEAAGVSSADAYRRAAHYGTNFYGQLAAAKLGANMLDIPYPKPSAQDRANFESREAVAAIRRLDAVGHGTRARSLYYAMADELDSVGELALLANQAGKNGDHFTALKVGKIAAARGLDVGALSHPLGAIPQDANISGSGKALAYAIARQESEFNHGAVSKVGALGLLQLMPATAKEVAGRNGMKYDRARLTVDPAYNATLGAHFLGEQIDRFDGSYILTFAGYNAGPRRSDEWVAKYGDPRGKSVDFAVDWIERIPFTETRNYVQRIMENYQVYKARLGGKVSIEGDLVNGRQS
jgi:soluble lytic murein transglycosylase